MMRSPIQPWSGLSAPLAEGAHEISFSSPFSVPAPALWVLDQRTTFAQFAGRAVGVPAPFSPTAAVPRFVPHDEPLAVNRRGNQARG